MIFLVETHCTPGLPSYLHRFLSTCIYGTLKSHESSSNHACCWLCTVRRWPSGCAHRIHLVLLNFLSQKDLASLPPANVHYRSLIVSIDRSMEHQNPPWNHFHSFPKNNHGLYGCPFISIVFPSVFSDVHGTSSSHPLARMSPRHLPGAAALRLRSSASHGDRPWGWYLPMIWEEFYGFGNGKNYRIL